MANLLIVDDHPDSCQSAAAFLTKFGHQVRCASNGREALFAILESKPDLIVFSEERKAKLAQRAAPDMTRELLQNRFDLKDQIEAIIERVRKWNE